MTQPELADKILFKNPWITGEDLIAAQIKGIGLQTIMDWADKGILGVGNNGLQRVDSVSNSSINAATL